MQPEREDRREPVKIRKDDGNKQSKTDASKQRETKQEDGFGMSEETGAEAAVKKKKIVKPEPSGKEIKLSPGNSKAVIDQLKKEDIKIGDFMMRILSREQKDKMVRSFTIHDFYDAIKAENDRFPKKKLMKQRLPLLLKT